MAVSLAFYEDLSKNQGQIAGGEGHSSDKTEDRYCW